MLARGTPWSYTVSSFDQWIERIIANCCQPDARSSLPIDAFEELVALVADNPAIGIADALARLGYLRNGEVVGFRLRELTDFPRGVDPADSRSKIAKRYLIWLREGR